MGFRSFFTALLFVAGLALTERTIQGQSPPGGTAESPLQARSPSSDLLIRDSELDAGKQPNDGQLWVSPDIMVDAPPIDGQYGNPVAKRENKVLVLVENKGASKIQPLFVYVYGALSSTSLPDLPPLFWKNFPRELPLYHDDAGGWVTGEWDYIGMSNAGSIEPAPSEKSKRKITVKESWIPLPKGVQPAGDQISYCLLAIAFTDTDTAPTELGIGDLVQNHSSIAMRNVQIVQGPTATLRSLPFLIGNPFEQPTAKAGIAIEAPPGWTARFDSGARRGSLGLGAGEQRPFEVRLWVPDLFDPKGPLGPRRIIVRQTIDGKETGLVAFDFDLRQTAPWTWTVRTGLPEVRSRGSEQGGKNHLAVTLERRLSTSSSLALETGRIGLDRSRGEGREEAESWTYLAFQGKHRFGLARLRPFAAAGIGVYDFDRSTEAGWQIGTGVGWLAHPKVEIELGGTYHRAFDGGTRAWIPGLAITFRR